jgi:hypothetical protein
VATDGGIILPPVVLTLSFTWHVLDAAHIVKAPKAALTDLKWLVSMPKLASFLLAMSSIQSLLKGLVLDAAEE